VRCLAEFRNVIGQEVERKSSYAGTPSLSKKDVDTGSRCTRRGKRLTNRPLVAGMNTFDLQRS
jgi:hypothetical protein